MKLFVDDIRACPFGWTQACTVSEAIRILATQKVDHVSLDHDIAFQGRHGIELETYEGVAWYIALMYKPPRVTIHTGNGVAGARMAAILKEAGIHAVMTIGCFDVDADERTGQTDQSAL